MNRIHSILAATDLSDVAGKAIERAALLAAEFGAHLALTNIISRGTLNALHDLMAPDSSDDLENRLVSEALARMQKLAEDIKAQHAVQAEVSVSAGSVLRQINRQADSIDASLLVMGAHGGGFVRDLLLGSTTDRVLRKTERPMLVVRVQPSGRYRRVLVPVDFSERSSAALSLAREIAPGAQIVLLHSFEVPYEGQLRMAGVAEKTVEDLRRAAKQDAIKRLDALAEAAGVPKENVHRVLVHGQPASAIVEQAASHDCDLITMGKQGLRMVEELVLGSVTRQVLEHAHCDVLVADRHKR
ncbi:universal stress protein [Rhodocyclaceae bacterium SMB388]